MGPREREVQRALASSTGERKIAIFLKNNPSMMLSSFGEHGNHGNYILKEFKLGHSYVADFVILQAYSGSWRVDFIELEGVKDRFVTKAGKPSRMLGTALKQIEDWKLFTHTHRAEVHEHLADEVLKRDILKLSYIGDDISNARGQRVRYPATFLRTYYHVVIGRREDLTPAADQLRSRSLLGEVFIATYDRILDGARELDSPRAHSPQI
jgi:hypothetical protein